MNKGNKYSFGKHTNKSVELLLNHFRVNTNNLHFQNKGERIVFANQYATKISEWQRNFHAPDRAKIFYAIMYYIHFK